MVLSRLHDADTNVMASHGITPMPVATCDAYGITQQNMTLHLISVVLT